ncbi:hypothetical protein GCM10009616_11390 [Microlunatus lacustris]
MRAVIYVRVSSLSRDDPSTSPERQLESCSQYAASKGWQVVRVVRDLNVSGSAGGLRLQRPGLVEIRQLWGSVDAVIVARLDRLARSVSDFDSFGPGGPLTRRVRRLRRGVDRPHNADGRVHHERLRAAGGRSGRVRPPMR